MSNQNGLTILGKQHQIGFPVTWLSALVDVGRALIDGDTPLDAIHRAPAFAPAPTALAFPPRQVVPPAVVLGAADLGVDEPIDRFIADDRAFCTVSSADRPLGPATSLGRSRVKTLA